MFEIAPHLRPPLATLLTFVFPLAVIAGFLLGRTSRATWGKVFVRAALAGALLTAGSAALVSHRHAGTGTQEARGWPRIVYARWDSWEVSESRAGVSWRGVLENGFLYGIAAAAVLAAIHTMVPPSSDG